MKLVLNTALDPHFCAILNTDNTVFQKTEWTNRRQDGKEIWNFLQKHKSPQIKFEMIGGISGPGGFSSLRASAGILNALAFSQEILVKQIRADFFVTAFLKFHKHKPNFVLNSFGDCVFMPDGNNLKRIKTEEAVRFFGEKEVFIDLLPEEKATLFKNKIDLKFQNTESILGKILSTQKSQKVFIPDYGFDPV